MRSGTFGKLLRRVGDAPGYPASPACLWIEHADRMAVFRTNCIMQPDDATAKGFEIQQRSMLLLGGVLVEQEVVSLSLQ